MKIKIKSWIFKCVAMIVLVTAIGLAMGEKAENNDFEKALFEAASQMNKNLPMMIDSETRLDSTMASPGKIFIYSYTVVNYTIAELDVEAFTNAMRPNLVNHTKTSKDMESFRKNKVTLKYNYRDKNGREIAQITITPNDYR